jgi:predicted nucleic acid-binding protein
VRLFLDTSVLLAASGSTRGASRFLIAEAQAHRWELVSSDYCDEETRRNLPKLGRSAATAWKSNIALRAGESRPRQAARLPESKGPADRHHRLGGSV